MFDTKWVTDAENVDLFVVIRILEIIMSVMIHYGKKIETYIICMTTVIHKICFYLTLTIQDIEIGHIFMILNIVIVDRKYLILKTVMLIGVHMKH